MAIGAINCNSKSDPKGRSSLCLPRKTTRRMTRVRGRGVNFMTSQRKRKKGEGKCGRDSSITDICVSKKRGGIGFTSKYRISSDRHSRYPLIRRMYFFQSRSARGKVGKGPSHQFHMTNEGRKPAINAISRKDETKNRHTTLLVNCRWGGSVE